MKDFRKYMHIEKFGHDEVENIEIGSVYVFPKIDGSNGSVWINDGNLCAASRNRKLSLEHDNQGFLQYVLENEELFWNFFKIYPNVILYGEWLIPHSLKTYRKDTWNKFYVFDVFDIKKNMYLPYHIYNTMLDESNIEYITPIKILKNASYDDFIFQMQQNNYLIEDGKGIGEGIILKNYEYKNKYDRICYAKIITSEFKEKHIKKMGVPLVEYDLREENIIDKYLTEALIEKEYSKIINEKEWNNKLIPMLFGRIYHCFITEELWNIIKKEKKLKIDFNLLNRFLILKIKKVMKNLFVEE